MISIIIPTYNESKNIGVIIPKIYHELSRLKRSFEILIVDDNSPDLTWKIAKEYSRYNVRVIRRLKDRGLSNSVIEGFERLRGDILIVMDADLSHPVKLLPKLLEKSDGNDIVIASRYVGKGKEKFTFYRKMVSSVAKSLTKPLTRVSDPMSGYFLIKKDILKGAKLRPKGYKILLEILVRCKYETIAEVPYSFQERLHGKSKLGLKVYFDYISQLFSLYLYRIFH